MRTYMRAFGPATAADFAMLTGLNLRDAREVWAHERAHFVPVNVAGWEEAILRQDLDDLVQADFERPLVRLLPYFDSSLLAHKERAHLVASEHRPSVYRPQGWIVPVVLVNGRLAAVWEHAREENRLRIKVTKFDSLSRRIVTGIRAEAQDLCRFLGLTDVDIHVS